ncbi:MAG TPA: tetratricopeptide repeat protein [Chitinophagales bacterium]|nr:tetratricopeptide repeat protein [Chitinophagales bacterium]
MRKHLILSIFIAITVVLVLFLPSCKQCNKQVEVANTDTVSIPKLDAITAEITKDSLNPFLYYKRAQIYEANNDYKSAATDMFIALTLDSLRPEFYMYAAELFKRTAEPQRGLSLMQKAIATDSMNTAFYVKAAELAYIDTTLEGNYRRALDFLNAAIAKDPQNADIYFYKGTIFKEIGDTIKALSSFQTATELNPKFYNAYVQIGLLLKSKKDKNAEKYFDNAIKVSDNPEDALYAKANLLKEEGVRLYDANKLAQATEKLSKAAEQFKKVIEVNHKNVEAYMGTGFCYYQMDSVQDAYHYYDLATQVDPTYAGAYFSKGLCAEDLGRKKEAIGLYQTCLNIDPEFERAAQHLKNLNAAQ